MSDTEYGGANRVAYVSVNHLHKNAIDDPVYLELYFNPLFFDEQYGAVMSIQEARSIANALNRAADYFEDKAS